MRTGFLFSQDSFALYFFSGILVFRLGRHVPIFGQGGRPASFSFVSACQFRLHTYGASESAAPFFPFPQLQVLVQFFFCPFLRKKENGFQRLSFFSFSWAPPCIRAG